MIFLEEKLTKRVNIFDNKTKWKQEFKVFS